MSNNKPSLKKFCRITRFIEQINKSLFHAIDDLCITHYFKPSRATGGITFLLPKDKSYVQEIINGAYSTDPDVSVNMIKSLLLQKNYKKLSDFSNGDVINLLNQKIEVAEVSDNGVKLSNGLTIVENKQFSPMSGRDNMNVFDLVGKERISLNNQHVTVSPSGKGRKKTVGGNCFMGSSKKSLHRYLEDVYTDEMRSANNVYVKKVILQLEYLTKNKGVSNGDLVEYLGNDEVSDSYLLDMYCTSNYSSSFGVILGALKSGSSKISDLSFDKYIQTRRQILGDSPNNKNVSSRDTQLLRELYSPMDVRTRVCKSYGSDKSRLGKDLFIVFCNISKDLWMTSKDSVDDYKQFAYIASSIYTSPEDLVNQEFDSARDLTLYGNLLKSDVFKFVPQASFSKKEDVNLNIVSSMPSPLDMSPYSLCYLVNSYSTKTGVSGGGIYGGEEGGEIEALLSGL